MKPKIISGEKYYQTNQEIDLNKRLLEHHLAITHNSGHGWNLHNTATLQRKTLSRLLHYDALYKKIIGKPGHILEFGVQFGSTLSLLINLRGLYEPYNYQRKIVGFDTFTGYINLSSEDIKHKDNDPQLNQYSVPENYFEMLSELLSLQESLSPISHIKKFSLYKGDAIETIEQYLEDHNTPIAMAIFDMNLYSPTKLVLNKIIPRLFRGSLLVFDDLCSPDSPGEFSAVSEVLAINGLSLESNPNQTNSAYCIYQ